MNAQPTETPQVRCCECGQVMDAQFQRGVAHYPGHWLLTCMNRDRCLLYGFTFSGNNYPPANIAEYLTYAKEKSS